MKLIQCRFSSGQRLPLLIQAGDAAPLPVLFRSSKSNLNSDSALTTRLRRK